MFACLVSDETAQDKIWKQKGPLNAATFRRQLQNSLEADSMLDLVVFGAGTPQTKLPSFAQTLLLRLL